MNNRRAVAGRDAVIQSAYAEGEKLFINVGIQQDDNTFEYARISIESGNVEFADQIRIASTPGKMSASELRNFIEENLSALQSLALSTLSITE